MSPPPSPRLRPIVAALGITQIIGYGAVYYAYPILTPALAADFGADPSSAFLLLSIGMLTSGVAGPFFGRLMDRIGAARVMAMGSLGTGLLLLVVAAMPSFLPFAGVMLVILTIMPTVTYGAAFAALADASTADARRMITNLTLIAGFSSSIFWPMTGWLLELFGWRWTMVAYGAANIVVASPLHVLVVRLTGSSRRRSLAQAASAGSLEAGRRRRTFWLISLSIGLSGVPGSAMAALMVPVFQSMDLGTAAYLVAMLFGPTQILARLMEAFFWRGFHPLFTAIVAATAASVCNAMLLLPLPPIAAALLFVLFFGIAQGLASIVMGAVTLALFGPDGYGELMGRMALVRIMLTAGAPFLLSIGLATIGFSASFLVLFALSALALPPLLMLAKGHRLRG